MKFSPVWILAICHNFTAIKGYNIDIGNTNLMCFFLNSTVQRQIACQVQ